MPQESEIVRRMEKDLYYGNGKPGICTRMEVAEGHIEGVTERLDNIDKKFWALILLALTILGTDVASLFKDNHQDLQPIHSYNE